MESTVIGFPSIKTLNLEKKSKKNSIIPSEARSFPNCIKHGQYHQTQMASCQFQFLNLATQDTIVGLQQEFR